MKSKKIIASFLSACLLVSSFASVVSFAKAPSAKFDENNITMNFGAFSDVHQNGNAGSAAETKFKNALNSLNQKTNNNLDALFVAGDLTDSASDAQINQFKKVFTENTTDTSLIYALGNHDSSNGSNAKKFYEGFGAEFFKNDVDKDSIIKGNRHAVINGYHFITVEPSGYGGDPAYNCAYSAATVKWLENILITLNNEDPNKPIFIATHAMQYDTVYGSTLPGTGPGWYSKQLTSLLQKYPQVVTFGGHVHHPLNDERSIMQQGYTALGCGSISYMAIESGYTEENGTVPHDASNFSQGLLVQVDKDNNMRFVRMDFYNNREIKEAWVVPAPKSDKSHLNFYTKDRGNETNNSAPLFDENSSFTASAKNDRTVSLSFKAATDDDMVHHYEATITRKGDSEAETGRTIKTLSGFYRNKYPEIYNFKFDNLVLGDTYILNVYAVDSWGAKSIPLTKELTIPDTIVTPESLKPDIFDLNITENEITDISPLALNVTKGEQTEIFNDKRCDSFALKFNSDIKSAVNFVIPSDKTATLLDNFTLDTFFKTGESSNEEQIILSNRVTGGYNITINPKTHKINFNSMVGNLNRTLESKQEVLPNEYYHVTATFDGKELLLYVNGNIDDSLLISGKVLNVKGDKHYFSIGSNPTKTGGNKDSFNGSVLDAKIFSNALDTSHVRALTTPVIGPEPGPDYLLGDVNNDGKVSTLDVLGILKYLAKLETFNEVQMLAANFDSNSTINTLDALAILKKLANLT